MTNAIDEPGRTDGQGLPDSRNGADPLAVAMYRAAILEADRILTADADRLSLADVLELELTLEKIAAELM